MPQEPMSEETIVALIRGCVGNPACQSEILAAFRRLTEENQRLTGALARERRTRDALFKETLDHAFAMATVWKELAILRAGVESSALLIAAMETCHICGGELLISEGPPHCEDSCSWDCEEHDEPACTGIDVLHANAKRAIGKEAITAALEKQVELHALRAGVEAVESLSPDSYHSPDGLHHKTGVSDAFHWAKEAMRSAMESVKEKKDGR